VARLARILLVAYLVASTGGWLDLLLPEPCSPTESASAPADGACAATCVRCHCTLAFDVALPVRVSEALPLSADWIGLTTTVPLPAPDDILHVPRPALA
jgi:hypothetical protein